MQWESPKLLIVSDDLAKELEIDDTKSQSFLHIVSGNELIKNTKPYAMCYGGYQFSHWAGQLGDGRAINIAEVLVKNKIYTLQLKGAGPTPYSRSADGLAVLRSSIREFLCSEAMYHLGIPTTRALSLVLTGEKVIRDMLYDGNPAYEPGAIVCRVAPTFIRFGNFEIFAARKDIQNLQLLADYTIKHHFAYIKETGKEKYLRFFKEVALKTVEMIIDWQRVGFVHGVMNTDNMSILGQTIDYGPYGWIDNFDLGWTPNTTDAEHKRYRFSNQINIAFWNITQLANALYLLIEDIPPFEKIMQNAFNYFEERYLKMLNQKMGLQTIQEDDLALQKELMNVMEAASLDMTIFYRKLVDFNENNIDDFIDTCQSISYLNENDFNERKSKLLEFLSKYALRLKNEHINKKEKKALMNSINPKYVLRNYMAQLAIEDAEKGKYTLLHELYKLLKNPYAEQPEMEKWFAKRPDWALHKVGCSMLSCSS
ncbi:MAG: YdiU family protein [Chitinophagales bacterium]|nr:YdiU family protein [Chitinophagales bacterium]